MSYADFLARKTRTLDDDGIAPTAKGCIDGLVRAGILVDDGPRHVASVALGVDVDSNLNRPTVTVAIIPLPPAPPSPQDESPR